MELKHYKLKPITSEEEFEEASRIIDQLIDSDLIEDPVKRKEALNFLEAISLLATAYEEKHHPIPSPDPIKAIKERMSQLDLSPKDVAAWFGGENRVSEVLNGKRKLSIRMIRALNKHLKIPAEILLG
jgi:HTH-type transcriptional regulator/antitoxin HigA